MTPLLQDRAVRRRGRVLTGVKERVFLILAAFLAVVMLSGFSCEPKEVKRVREMPIADVDLSAVPDGVRNGSFTFDGFTYEVKTTVENHRIAKIGPVSANKSSRMKKAVAVLPLVIERQTPNVDAATGATATTKALLKAVERSLTGK